MRRNPRGNKPKYNLLNVAAFAILPSSFPGKNLVWTRFPACPAQTSTQHVAKTVLCEGSQLEDDAFRKKQAVTGITTTRPK
jgi:hypothetical protein